MEHVQNKILLYMGPKSEKLIAPPDDIGQITIDFINGAEKSLDIAVQELDSRPIAEAIIQAKRRGVRIRVVLESDYLKSAKMRSDPKRGGGKQETNRTIQNWLLRSAIWVRSDFNPNIFHQKFIVRDRKSLLTGSMNFTRTGIEENLNHIVIVHDEDVAMAYRREFNELATGSFGLRSKSQGDTPVNAEVAKVPIKICFAPDHNPEMEIMKQMLKAKNRIDFAIFTFSTSSGIDDAMISQLNAGVKVRGILDSMMANQSWAAAHPIQAAGAEVYKIKYESPVRKLHHKLMIIDEQVLVVGSFNYTGPANAVNDENIMILGDLASAGQDSINAQKKLATYALKEVDRIIKEDGEPL